MKECVKVMEEREYQKVIAYLCELVKTGELEIGSKIPTERNLAELLSVGRGSTREALRILESMGILICRQGSGNYIAGNPSKKVSGMIEMMLLLRQIRKEEVIQFRRDMEKAICNTIIERGSMERWRGRIEEILAVDTDYQSLEEQIEADRKFHYRLILATENQLWLCISEAVVDIYQHWIERVLREAPPEVKRELHQSHMAMVSALAQGSRAGVEAAIDRHYDLADRELRKTELIGGD